MLAQFDVRRKLVVDLLNDLPGVSCITPKGAFCMRFPNITATGWKWLTGWLAALLEDTACNAWWWT